MPDSLQISPPIISSMCCHWSILALFFTTLFCFWHSSHSCFLLIRKSNIWTELIFLACFFFCSFIPFNVSDDICELSSFFFFTCYSHHCFLCYSLVSFPNIFHTLLLQFSQIPFDCHSIALQYCLVF